MNLPSYLSGAIFAKSHSVLRTTVRGCLRRHDLTPTAWSFLGAVLKASPDGIRMVALADRLGVKSPLITAMAHGLIERDLIKRIPHHTDHRAKLLVITPTGKRFIQLVEQDMEQSLTGLLAGLTEDDLEAYKKVLETIITNGQ